MLREVTAVGGREQVRREQLWVRDHVERVAPGTT
jgi:hypothetical protein